MNKAEDIEQLIYRELPPDRYCYIHNFIVEKDKEIERLNNIINELEKRTLQRDKLKERLKGTKKMKDELKEFNIKLEDIEENDYLFNNINEAVEKMRVATLKDRFEVVLNNNLIETKDKYTGFRTILGCRISYDDLDKNVSFIVREDTKPTYEELEDNWDKLKEWLESNWEESQDIWFVKIINKMQELEQGSDKE